MTLSNWLRLLLVVFVALVVQLAVLDQLVIVDAHPDVLVLFPVAAALLAGPERGMVVGFVVGLGADLLVSLPYGVSALTFVLLGFGVGQLGAIPGGMPSGSSRIFVCALGGAVGTLAYGLIGAVIGQVGMLGSNLLKSIAVVLVAGLALAPIVLAALSWAFRGWNRALTVVPLGGSATT